MVSERKLASAMGGKTVRACDNCIRKRARWYCPADDAFLCQNCDSSVHSANPLARRHERVRLKTSSLKESSPDENFPNLESPVSVSVSVSVPSWHRGFTRKARTPRNGRKVSKSTEEEEEEEVILKNPIHLVPEILSDENSLDENEEQLLYRVPIFDPFVAELYTSATRNDRMENVQTAADSEFKPESKETLQHDDNICNGDLNRFHGMLPSEMELAEFAADVENLLGKGLDDESFDMEGLGLLGGCNKEENSMECSMVSIHEKVKIEDEGEGDEVVMDTTTTNHDIDINGDTFEFKFDYDSPMNINGGDEVGEVVMKINGEDGDGNYNEKKKILLNLDYESVLTAWADQRSPWTNGERPELDSNDCWPDCMGNCGTIHPYGIMNGHTTIIDRGREARVSRYREKRRTRLFSKKIRYEVRKLNAEKRPRMKGRFVKRSNLVPNYPLLK
ncbi:zinc finger protein CONSTANS-LIKE 16-like [Nicotiana sylvestris]|uniref:Zinc finger protein CONSTANS-LIKE 16-like n=1 Tax=Nicotiana sylvestris TaxID=4096 RepID=A0A1U7WK78_NICSY|nr:PREDICTED: zinc finger protein CONSTANS-LIKE 16-like [Nicotiana sylvestris]